MKRRPYIALVDDDRQVLKFLQQELEESGYEVTGATSGRAVLNAIAERVPDLLILDLNMPELDGFDLLKILRSAHPYLRMVAISGFLRRPSIDAARYMGAIATIEKPVEPGGIVATVREVLGERSPDEQPVAAASAAAAALTYAPSSPAGPRAAAEEKPSKPNPRRPSTRAHKHR
jgi:DNA-binding NtrC family response regulator